MGAIIAVILFLSVLNLCSFFKNLYDYIKASQNKGSGITVTRDTDLMDLHHLSPREFESWCRIFLKRLGYSDMVLTPPSPDGGKDIICRMNNEIIYVECKRYVYRFNAERSVDTETVQKLLGAMIGDNVKSGIIITTGCITESARRFANTLESDFSIRLIDGMNLISLYNSTLENKDKDENQLKPSFTN